jgi:hypothetical protein
MFATPGDKFQLRLVLVLSVVLLFVGTIWRPSSLLLSTALVAAIIFLAGRAIMSLLCTDEALHSIKLRIQISPNYMAIGLGSCAALLLTGILRIADLYSVTAVLGALSAIVIASIVVASFRLLPEIKTFLTIEVFVCVLSWLLMWLIFSGHERQMGNVAVYITQGFDLLQREKDPSVWPYFGELYRMPFTYVTHNIGATFALFSVGDHSAYYEHGQFWINVVLAPLVPLGAYLFFKRFVPSWASLLLTGFFVTTTVGFRIVSVRGESLGWILGFGFLLGLVDVLRRYEAGQVDRHTYGLLAATTALYFSAALTHGVVAMVISFLAAGILIHQLMANRANLQIGTLIRLTASSAAVVILMGSIYWAGFLRGYESTYEPSSRTGDPDAALLIEGEFSNQSIVRETLESELHPVPKTPS